MAERNRREERLSIGQGWLLFAGGMFLAAVTGWIVGQVIGKWLG